MPQITTVGVAGLGLLGRSIAACCLGHGFRVVAFTRKAETIETARQFIRQALQDLVKRAGYPTRVRDRVDDAFEPVTTWQPLSRAELIVESVIEDLTAKRQTYDQLERLVSPRVPIASNTSAIAIEQLQQGRRHPERLIGMHWSDYAHATRFMEITPGPQTADETTETVLRFAKQLGKEPCVVQHDVPGFICNRLAYAMYREALHLHAMGVADFRTIDRSVRNSLGLWAALCGPFRWMDLSGGPELYARAMQHVLPTLDQSPEVPDSLRRLLDQGITRFYPDEADQRAKWEARFREAVWHVKAFQDQHLPLEHDE